MEEQMQQTPTKTKTPSGEKNTGMAIVAYILFFIPLLIGAHKDPFVKFHVKQGLVLFCIAIIIWIIAAIIPWYWWWNLFWIVRILQLGLLVLVILGIINASQGKEEPLPIVGQFAKLFKF
jgi:uncharacterized membrane protein